MLTIAILLLTLWKVLPFSFCVRLPFPREKVVCQQFVISLSSGKKATADTFEAINPHGYRAVSIVSIVSSYGRGYMISLLFGIFGEYILNGGAKDIEAPVLESFLEQVSP